MKKKTNSNLMIIFLFALGLAILLYPTISNAWNERLANRLIVNHEQTIAEIDLETISKVKADAIAYNNSLVGGKVPDAFAYEEANKPNELYESLLNITGDGYMCTVEIPVINVKLPVYHYTTEAVLEKGVGHLPGSSLPVGGMHTHSVLSAHRGLPSAKLFTDLDRVSEGDIFYIYVLNEVLAYEVDLIKVIEPTETEDLAIANNEDYVTLFTCTPYAVNSHRLLVRGHRIPYDQSQYEVETHKTGVVNTNLLLIRIACVLIGIWLALLFVYVYKKIEQKKKKNNKIKSSKGAKNEQGS